MTLEKKIRNDLAAGKTTADALSLRMEVSIPAVMTVLDRLQREGSVITMPICDGRLTVWKLKEDMR